MVHTVKGNVFDSDFDIIAHGCNCKGGFGAGVALAVAQKYPKARHHYLDKHRTEGWRLGEVQFVKVLGRQQYIANCATQKSFLPRGRKHADYDAIRTCMEKVRDFAKENKMTVAIPKIGAGLAGGDWKTIKKILDEVFVDFDVTVRYLE